MTVTTVIVFFHSSWDLARFVPRRCAVVVPESLQIRTAIPQEASLRNLERMISVRSLEGPTQLAA